MSGSVEGAGFWLPSEFFDDIVTDKDNLDKNHAADSDSEFCFPTEFPYDFQIETGDRFKEKRCVMSTSPQSTLSHLWSFSARSAGGSSNGSPNGVTSPPATPLGAEKDAVGELIYRAAGQVAKLKLNGGDVPGPAKHSGLPGPPRSLERLYPAANKPSPSVFHNIYLQEQMMKQRKQGSGMWYSEAQMYHGWSVQQDPTRIGRSGSSGVLFGGSGGAAVKRECAGTGVFLPRRYGNISDDCANAYSSDSRKRPGHSSAPYIPERNVHALNKSFDKINGYVPSQPQFQPKFSPGFVSEYDLLMARRNAFIAQHRRILLVEKSNPMSCGMCLPQDWTY
ncbi:hypothetical protein PHJA_000777800 [Phtheirospermum japonicum]|uniref:Uncharacterized protein n=1 Tax=Phtheirospermum japonicum TaxID=374723 RepID=A0A830BFE7_9LAMI|nr:hypothetical protein PHJA_000777800 [Phtheirospermum japonicum]